MRRFREQLVSKTPSIGLGTWIKIDRKRAAGGIFLDSSSENYALALPQIKDEFVDKSELTPTARSSLERIATAGNSKVMFMI